MFPAASASASASASPSPPSGASSPSGTNRQSVGSSQGDPFQYQGRVSASTPGEAGPSDWVTVASGEDETDDVRIPFPSRFVGGRPTGESIANVTDDYPPEDVYSSSLGAEQGSAPVSGASNVATTAADNRRRRHHQHHQLPFALAGLDMAQRRERGGRGGEGSDVAFARGRGDSTGLGSSALAALAYLDRQDVESSVGSGQHVSIVAHASSSSAVPPSGEQQSASLGGVRVRVRGLVRDFGRSLTESVTGYTLPGRVIPLGDDTPTRPPRGNRRAAAAATTTTTSTTAAAIAVTPAAAATTASTNAEVEVDPIISAEYRVASAFLSLGPEEERQDSSNMATAGSSPYVEDVQIHRCSEDVQSRTTQEGRQRYLDHDRRPNITTYRIPQPIARAGSHGAFRYHSGAHQAGPSSAGASFVAGPSRVAGPSVGLPYQHLIAEASEAATTGLNRNRGLSAGAVSETSSAVPMGYFDNDYQWNRRLQRLLTPPTMVTNHSTRTLTSPPSIPTPTFLSTTMSPIRQGITRLFGRGGRQRNNNGNRVNNNNNAQDQDVELGDGFEDVELGPMSEETAFSSARTPTSFETPPHMVPRATITRRDNYNYSMSSSLPYHVQSASRASVPASDGPGNPGTFVSTEALRRRRNLFYIMYWFGVFMVLPTVFALTFVDRSMIRGITRGQLNGWSYEQRRRFIIMASVQLGLIAALVVVLAWYGGSRIGGM